MEIKTEGDKKTVTKTFKRSNFTFTSEGETENDKMSKNLPETIKSIKDDGFEEVESYHDIPIGSWVKYVTTQNLFRNGGFLMLVTDDYMFLRNGATNIGWSVQKKNIKQLFYKEISRKNIKKEKQEKWDKLLDTLFYEEKNYVGSDKLYRLAKEEDDNITRSYVREWYKKIDLNQIMAPRRKEKGTRSVQSSEPNKIYAMDLIDYANDKGRNKKYAYIMVVLDIFTKFAWAQALTSRKPEAIAEAWKKLEKKQYFHRPGSVLSDNDTAFKTDFADLMRERGIKRLFIVPGQPQGNQAERLIKTLKGMLNKFYEEEKKGKRIWIDDYETIVNNYNKHYHETIKKTPLEALDKDNWEEVRKNIEKNSIVNDPTDLKLKVGDKVRIQLKKDKVGKKDGINWSKEVYEVTKVFNYRNTLKPTSYKLKDEDGDEYPGLVNVSRLQKV